MPDEMSQRRGKFYFTEKETQVQIKQATCWCLYVGILVPVPVTEYLVSGNLEMGSAHPQ